MGKLEKTGEANGKKKLWIGLVVIAVVAVAGGVFRFGSKRIETEETSGTIAEIGTMGQESVIGEVEMELLSNLYDTMVRSSYAETARLLNENEEKFKEILTTTLSGKRYCYWETVYEEGKIVRHMEPLKTEGEMEGMVLTRFNTVFYGKYVDGKPDGECHAIQAMILDEPRYTYAEGIWAAGKMNGEGKTGYHYYQSAPDSGFIMAEKSGAYEDNLLDGEFLYQTESLTGEKLSWKIEAKEGVTVINERWSHYPLRSEYMLGSEENSARAYVLSEEKTTAILWNNLILWNEIKE